MYIPSVKGSEWLVFQIMVGKEQFETVISHRSATFGQKLEHFLILFQQVFEVNRDDLIRSVWNR